MPAATATTPRRRENRPVPNLAADIFRQAAKLNLEDPRRSGNVVAVESGCDLLVSGDLHGYRTGLTKLISAAGLAGNPQRRLVLQEIIHGPPDAASSQDRSLELLMRAARLKVSHPAQVLFVLGNHDVAQVTGNEITKEGRGVVKAFLAGVRFAFPDATDEMLPAINEFLLSIPLALRCPNKVFIAHSLPSPSRMAMAGMEILGRPIVPQDLRRGGGAYEWTWGRDHTADQLESLAGQLDIEYFILGHRHSQQGYEVVSPRGLTISTDHERGYVMAFGGDQPLDGGRPEAYLKAILTLA